ncbi:unnamed protein product [Allacma fusca]|uniref:Methyltransferase type 11 domain-containing protein n=1 Tax=Allacma fusca TaxID=39272 RepID=A0A8J2JX89_9HEXA|nr:unnamed protein product [Allacma fusca]
MAEIDVIVRDTIFKYLVPICILVSLCVVYIGELSKAIRDRLFGKRLKKFTELYYKRLEDVRKALFDDLNVLESKVVDLKNRGLIRILEIGVGEGTNLSYYPQQSRLVVVDPRPHFVQYFFENKEKFRDIVLEKFVHSGAEHMRKIQSDSVDVVVTTLVQCCVEDADAVLQEILRVLVKGGRYYYLEHVMDHPDTKRYRQQKWLTKLGIWPWIFDGCHLDREFDVQVAKAGFSEVDQKRFFINTAGSRILDIIQPHIVGVAVK